MKDSQNPAMQLAKQLLSQDSAPTTIGELNARLAVYQAPPLTVLEYARAKFQVRVARGEAKYVGGRPSKPSVSTADASANELVQSVAKLAEERNLYREECARLRATLKRIAANAAKVEA